MAKFQAKARVANADGTIRSDVCRMEDIDAGDQITLKILDVDKDDIGKGGS